MSLLDGRYQVGALPSGAGLIPGYDELLERPVDLLLLEPVPDLVRRARLLRGVRRAATSTGRRVAPVTDSGSADTRPFLAFPRDRALTEVLPLSVNSAVAVVLDAITGVQALRRAGLAPLSLQPEHLRLGPEGLRVLPAPPRSAPPPEDVRATGALLARLLSQTDGPPPDQLTAIVAATSGDAPTPIRDLARLTAQLRAWLNDPRPQVGPRGAASPPGATALRPAPQPQPRPATPAGPQPQGAAAEPPRRDRAEATTTVASPLARAGEGHDTQMTAETILLPRVDPAARPAEPSRGAGSRVGEAVTEPLSGRADRTSPQEAATAPQPQEASTQADTLAGADTGELGADTAPTPLYVPLASLLHDDDDEAERPPAHFRSGPHRG